MDLSSPGHGGVSRKSRSSSSVGSENHPIADSFSSLEPSKEDLDLAEMKASSGLRGAASLPHIVKDAKSDFVLTSKSESDVENLDRSELGATARVVDDDDDASSVVLRHPTDATLHHHPTTFEDFSPSLSSVVDSPLPPLPVGQKSYDYLLKFLLVGDSDVGKQEILASFEDGTTESPFCSSSGAAFKTTTILIDGKRVKLQLWDTSGQGRFCTIIRSYSRGAQGILLVYDITNKWSFEGINRWLKEVDQHAPGIPKVLVGNRLHLAFRRQVDPMEAEIYAERNSMGFFEVSPLVNFNISESFVELARMALKRNGMERLWRSNKVSSLYEACAHAIVNRTTVYGIDRLPLPDSVKQNLKSYALTNYAGRPTFMGSGSGGGISGLNRTSAPFYKSLKQSKKHHRQPLTPADAAKVNCGGGRKSCNIS